MTARAVRAVFFWKYSKAAFAANYGRISGSSEYSKDFLQSPAQQYPIIDKVLGRTTESIPIRHVWPGGEQAGEWRLYDTADDTRGQLSWLPMSASPRPWRVGDPHTDQTITIPGTPQILNEAGANSEFDKLKALDLDPWIISVKLQDDNNNLHARAYLGKPSPGFETRSVSTLPTRVQAAIAALSANRVAGAVEFDAQPALASRAPELVRDIAEALSRDPNVLLIGPPGTGKTVALEDLQADFIRQAGSIFFDPDLWENAWTEIGADERRTLSVVFHPSYGYEDFVAGLLPSMESGGFRLTAKPGPLVSLAHWATDSPGRRALLIIDEFNRGPTSAIFGDTLALLDADKRSDPSGRPGAKIVRPYPREEMNVEAVFANLTGSTEVSTEFGLPTSLWIVAALNSSDRSVAPLDAALRRRFVIISVPPDYNALARHLGVTCPGENDKFEPSDFDPAKWSASDAKRLILFVLRSLNERIGLVLGPDFLLGHALLWPVSGETAEEVARAAAHAFDERIGAALRLSFSDQDEALAAILRAGGANAQVGMPTAGIGIAKWHLPTDDMQAVASPRLEVVRLTGRPFPDILTALRALL